jgi:catechol 2,3-dioxygenase-like lactoylglutathione lyase family enzyme
MIRRFGVSVQAIRKVVHQRAPQPTWFWMEGSNMGGADLPKVSAESLVPILYVRDFAEARKYYTKKLLFEALWDWGKPPTFGCVRLDKVEIFFCEGEQGHSGTWLCIFVDDVDDYYERITKLGADVIMPPTDRPWGMREIHVRDPNGHVIRFGHGIPAREPKMEIERVPLEARIEKRLAAVIEDVARRNKVTLGEMLEETLLHSFEPLPKGGVASPHTAATHRYIQQLRKEHGLDYDCHANYRFVEKPLPTAKGKNIVKRKKV